MRHENKKEHSELGNPEQQQQVEQEFRTVREGERGQKPQSSLHLWERGQRLLLEAIEEIPGTEYVDEETHQKRMDICGGCERLDKEKNKCTVCKCFIDQKTRVKILPLVGKVECPLNKW